MTPEQRKEYQRKWYLAHREDRRQRYQRQRAKWLKYAKARYRIPEVRERKRVYSKAYHEANRDSRNAYRREYQKVNREKLRETKYRWRKRNPEKFRQLHAAHFARWKANNPEKNRAHQKVAQALRDGKLIRPKLCSSCGSRGRIEAHHPDYSKPLDVVWVCHACHRRIEGRDGRH